MQITGQAFWDPLASIVIGLLLIVVAVTMARDTGRLLVGASALPEERDAIDQVLRKSPGVDDVKELLTMVLGPRALLVAARVDLADDVDSAEVEQAASALDSRDPQGCAGRDRGVHRRHARRRPCGS